MSDTEKILALGALLANTLARGDVIMSLSTCNELRAEAGLPPLEVVDGELVESETAASVS